LKFFNQITGKLRKRIIVMGITVVLGVAGISVNPALITSAGEFVYILTEGGEGESE